MDLVSTVWRILNERQIEEFHELPNYLRELLGDEPEIDRIELAAINPRQPQSIHFVVEQAKAALEERYPNPKRDSKKIDPRTRLLDLVTRRDFRYFTEIPDLLTELGYGEHYDTKTIRINNLHDAYEDLDKDPFVNDTIKRVRELLEKT